VTAEGSAVAMAARNAADGRLYPGLHQSLGKLGRHVLDASIRMTDQPVAMDGPPLMERLHQGIEDEAAKSCSAHPPADDTAGECIDHGHHVNEALPGGH